MKQYLTFLLLLLTIQSFSQNKDESNSTFAFKNNVNTEFFGNSLVYSFNYERVLVNRNRFKTTAQVGVAYYPFEVNLTSPIVLSELLSFKKNHIELGVGYIFIFELWDTGDDDEAMNQVYGLYSARIGYRYQKPDGRFTFKLAFTPYFTSGANDSYDYEPWGGFSFGYNFGRK